MFDRVFMSKNNNNKTESKELINNLTFCVFDLETTGGNHETDKIIEIGLVKIKNLKIISEKNFLIQPEIQIPEFIQKLTSISPKDVKNAKLIEDVIDEILDFMSDSILVAHNASFDIPFFNSVLKRLDKPILENKSICTVLMTKYLIPNLLNSNLNYMSKIFGIKHKKAHRALDDASATANLLLTYLKIFIDKGIKKINHLYYPRNKYELDRINFRKKDSNPNEISKLLKNLKSPYLITFKGKNGIILFSYPGSNIKKEYDFIISKINNIPWEMVTIRLFGPFIEALIHFNNYYNKLEQNVKIEVMEKLWQAHFSSAPPPPPATHDPSSNFQPIETEWDFIICNHLVPEQFLIYPTMSLHQKSGLIFRYPGHKKKLLQYINSKISKMSNHKIRKIHYAPLLRKFISSYIQEANNKRGKPFFIFKKHFPQKNEDQFLKDLDSFFQGNPTKYNYPKEYI